VDNTYRPKYPRAKLREIVKKHIAVFRTLRLTPNCDVAFIGADNTVGEPRVRAWLLTDPQASSGGRYLLLDDGDVWREVECSPAAGDEAERCWLNGPDDDLVLLLSHAQANARLGGGGFLEEEASVLLDPHLVTDRREAERSHDGRERREGR
jgi:hypothetical protein